MGLVERIEDALSAADDLADLALELNDGPDSQRMTSAIRRYRAAVRGLDLRSLVSARQEAK